MQPIEKTLKDSEIQNICSAIIENVKKNTNAELRE